VTTRSDRDEVVDGVLRAGRLVAIAAGSLAEVGEEVTLTQYRSLVVLAPHGPQGIGSLAEARRVTSPTASRLAELPTVTVYRHADRFYGGHQPRATV